MIQFLIIAGLLFITSTLLVMFWTVVRRALEVIFFMIGIVAICILWVIGLGFEMVKETYYDRRVEK